MTTGVIYAVNGVMCLAVAIGLALRGEGVDIAGGDTEEEQMRNEKGLAGWTVAGALLGMLAWPLMVARELWQWKRYHLPRFEWDDVARYSLAIMTGAVLHMMALTMTGCQSGRATAERASERTDTVYMARESHDDTYKARVWGDTLRQLDSVWVESWRSGDTVYREKTAWRWRDRIQVHMDTVWRMAQMTDTVSKSTACNINEKITAVEKGRTVLVIMLWMTLLVAVVVIGVFCVQGMRKR